MATFNKSNWTRTGAAETAVVYSPASQGFGIPAGAIGAGTTVFTYAVPFRFKGNGQVETSIAAQQATTLMATGANSASLGTTQLLAPSSGSYSAGNHPRVAFTVVGTGTGVTIPVGGIDVIFVMY